jgi:hypothetical protein
MAIALHNMPVQVAPPLRTCFPILSPTPCVCACVRFAFLAQSAAVQGASGAVETMSSPVHFQPVESTPSLDCDNSSPRHTTSAAMLAPTPVRAASSSASMGTSLAPSAVTPLPSSPEGVGATTWVLRRSSTSVAPESDTRGDVNSPDVTTLSTHATPSVASSAQASPRLAVRRHMLSVGDKESSAERLKRALEVSSRAPGLPLPTQPPALTTGVVAEEGQPSPPPSPTPHLAVIGATSSLRQAIVNQISAASSSDLLADASSGNSTPRRSQNTRGSVAAVSGDDGGGGGARARRGGGGGRRSIVVIVQPTLWSRLLGGTVDYNNLESAFLISSVLVLISGMVSTGGGGCHARAHAW